MRKFKKNKIKSNSENKSTDTLIQKIVNAAQFDNPVKAITLLDEFKIKMKDDYTTFVNEILNNVDMVPPHSKKLFAYYLSDYCTRLAIEERIGSVDQFFERILEIVPDDIRVMINYGNALDFNRKHDDAIKMYKQVLKIEPDNQTALLNYSISLSHKGEYDASMKEVKKILNTDTPFPNAIYMHGMSLMGTKQFNAAIKEFKKFMEIEPNFVNAINNLGYCLSTTDQFKEAVEQFKKLVTLKTDYNLGWLNYGTALIFIGDLKSALSKYEVLLKIDPNFQFKSFIYFIMGVLSYKYDLNQNGDKYFKIFTKNLNDNDTKIIKSFQDNLKNNKNEALGDLKEIIETIEEFSNAYYMTTFFQPIEKYVEMIKKA